MSAVLQGNRLMRSSKYMIIVQTEISLPAAEARRPKAGGNKHSTLTLSYQKLILTVHFEIVFHRQYKVEYKVNHSWVLLDAEEF